MKGWFFWGAFGAATLVTALACWVGWVFFIHPMDEAVKTANRLEQRCAAALGISPRILANAGVLFAQKSHVEVLVTATRETTVEETFEGQNPSGGDVRVQAQFFAEAGVFTRAPFQIDVRKGGRLVDADLPQVKILRLEMRDPVVLEPGGTLWMDLPERLKLRVARSLERLAKQGMVAQGMLDTASTELENRVRAVGVEAGCEIVFKSQTEAE